MKNSNMQRDPMVEHQCIRLLTRVVFSWAWPALRVLAEGRVASLQCITNMLVDDKIFCITFTFEWTF